MNHRTESLLLCLLMLLGIVTVFPASSASSMSAKAIGGSMVKLAAPVVPAAYSLRSISNQAAIQGPVIQGWGGVTLDEASSGEMQSTLQRLNQSGYNAVRVGFGASITPCSSGELGAWSPTWFNQTIQIAKQYDMWVILDYHSYRDLVDGCQLQWLSFWTGVLSTNWYYNRIVWEPINEPAGTVSVLSAAYQTWISQARVLMDTHWIAVENTISNDGCAFDFISLVSCYPTVTDPINRIFLSIHPYFFYDQWLSGGYGTCGPSTRTWSNSTAECVADIYNQGMLNASATYHMPILDTEGGAVYYSCNNVCANPLDAVGTDDASYSTTTLHFIQYLTTQMQSENMGWIWWEAGEGSCCGALDTWGNLLKFHPITPPPDQPPNLQAPTGLTVVAGDSLTFKVNASDPDTPPQNLTLSCLDCPAGANFPVVSGLGQITGIFTWIPSVAQAGQSYNITFTTSDGVKSSDATILVTIYPPNKPPTNLPPILIIPGNRSVTVAQTLSFGVNATDTNTSPETLTLLCTNCDTIGAAFTSLPGISTATGRLSWVPSNTRLPGIYFAEFAVTNGLNSSTAIVHITITKAIVNLTASVYPKTLTLGLSSSASEVASITNGFNPTGTIAFTAFLNNETCTGTPSFTSIVPVNGNGNYASQPFTPEIPGTYRWEATYSGDAKNTGSGSVCGSSGRTLIVSPASPPPQPQPCQSCNSPNGSLTIDSPIVLLTIAATAGLATVITVAIYRKRIRRG